MEQIIGEVGESRATLGRGNAFEVPAHGTAPWVLRNVSC